MQTPEGNIIPFDELSDAQKQSTKLEKLTGKPHPVFTIGEELTIKGGKWRVTGFRGNRLFVKAIPY